MILINDEVGIINPKEVYERINVRCTKLCEIMDDEGVEQKRRDWAYDEYVGYQQELQNLNELFKVPFDVLVVVEKGV